MLNIYLDFTFKIPFEKRVTLVKDAGFDGVMLGFSEGLRYTQYDIVRSHGLEIENVHSPFDRMNTLWDICSESEYILNRTMECIRVCGENDVKTVIIHPTDGMIPPKITKFGLQNFEKLIDYAEKLGVDLAFENIQLPQFLEVIFDKFGQSDRVKFCYDVGHENCFSKGSDYLKKYGEKLCALHIHDNDGCSDGHLIPFDGNIDFNLFVEKLAKIGYKGAISLELYMGKSDKYKDYTAEKFISRAAETGRFICKKFSAMEGLYERLD